MNISDINDIQAEAGVISTLIYHPDFILHSEFLKAKHFFKTENGCIYWAIGELYKSGVDNIDSFNLSTMLNSNAKVKKTIENFNIKSIQEFVELSQNVARETLDEYIIIAKQVTTLAFKRELSKKLHGFENDCFSDKYDLGELNTRVYDGLNRISEEFVVADKVQVFGNKIDNIWNEIRQKQSGNDLYGIPSKFPVFNKMFTYEPAELVVFRASRKTGKSAILMNECLHKLKNGCASAYYDTEMSDRNFTERALANLSGVPVYKIKSGSYTPSEEILINDAKEFLRKAPFCHIYMPNWTLDSIYSTTKILQYKIGLQFLVFDYIKSNEVEVGKQYNDLGRLTSYLKNEIAGGLNLSVVSACQSNRKGEVSDSYKIEQYLSTEIILRPKTQDEVNVDGEECGNYAATVLLNRNGMQQSEDEYVDLVFKGSTMEIEESKRQHLLSELPI